VKLGYSAPSVVTFLHFGCCPYRPVVHGHVFLHKLL
jgi:hypothetical protein